MERFVFNPRRWPRVPARCQVVVASQDSQWQAETEDLGPGGCQLVSPRVIAPGGEVRLAIATQALADKLSVSGRVAWNNSTPPVRLGVAFEEGNVEPRSWFERLVEANPILAVAIHRVPDRLPVAAMLYLGEPPRFVIDFTPQELAVLRLLGHGIRIADVLTRAGLSTVESSRVVYCLLARRALVLARADAVPPRRWAEVLARAEEAIASEPPRPAAPKPPPPAREPLAPTIPRAPPPLPKAALGDSPPSRMDARVELAETKTAPVVSQPTSLGARGGQRSPEAQALFDEAQRQLAASDISGAIFNLRRALALSPRDGEVSSLLGQLAFRNRKLE